MGNTKRKRAIEILTRAEVAALVAQCSPKAPTGIRNRGMIIVMYAGGLRVEEMLALKPAEVDTATGEVRILHGKGDRQRSVGLGHGNMALVQRWLDVRVAPRSAPLFCTLAGGPVKDQYVRALMKRLATKAEIKKRVHPHVLRHTNADEMHAERTPVNLIRKHLGHNSLATTQIYLDHISPRDVVEAGRARDFNLEEI
jgi:integrase/recombinase XerC